MKALILIAIVFSTVAGGCRGCEPAAERPPAVPPAPEAAQPPANPPAEQPQAQQPAPAERQAPPGTEQEEDDCFAILDANPDYGAAPLKVQFSADVECTSGDPKYTWDFGDGSPTSNEPNPEHTYTKPGEYPASVVVVGPGGGTDSDDLDILVEEP
jgi:hypothetical protein